MPAIASACCWASAPASVTGDMAPASVKGVMTLTWPCSASVISPSAIGTSSCSGELVLMMPVNTGRSTSDSRESAERQRYHRQGIDGAGAPEGLGLPVLVGEGDLGIVEIEMAGGGGKIHRLERAAALLMDDVQDCTSRR